MQRPRTSSTRPKWDYYPTPGLVTQALCLALLELVPLEDLAADWLDPAAGEGMLIHAARKTSEIYGEAHWTALEIDSARADTCEWVADLTVTCDSLRSTWPTANVMANPPFNALDEFMPMIVDHCRQRRVWCAVFTPTCWWQAEKRVGATPPDLFLPLNWRPAFRKKDGAAHKGAQDFSWAVFAPMATGRCRWQRLPKPEVPGHVALK